MKKTFALSTFIIFAFSTANAMQQNQIDNSLLSRFTHFVKPAASCISNWYQRLSDNQRYGLKAVALFSACSLGYFAYKAYIHKSQQQKGASVSPKTETNKQKQTDAMIPTTDRKTLYGETITGNLTHIENIIRNSTILPLTMRHEISEKLKDLQHDPISGQCIDNNEKWYWKISINDSSTYMVALEKYI